MTTVDPAMLRTWASAELGGKLAPPVFQLLQWRSAMKLEALGMRHSSGRSVRAHAARVLGCKRGEAQALILRLLAEARPDLDAAAL